MRWNPKAPRSQTAQRVDGKPIGLYEYKRGKKRRAATARCPRCKRKRRMFIRANEQFYGRVAPMNVPGEGKVCWVCRIREVDPSWRPGKPIPLEKLSNPRRYKP